MIFYILMLLGVQSNWLVNNAIETKNQMKRKTWKEIMGRKNYHGKKTKLGVPFTCKEFSTM